MKHGDPPSAFAGARGFSERTKMLICSRMPDLCPPVGVYPDTPDATYRKWAAVSASMLKLVDTRTPAHVAAWMAGQQKPPTPALLFGAAYHCFVLEPGEFERRYIVSEKMVANKKHKEYAALVERAGGDEARILWTEEVEKMAAMRAALHQQTRTRKLVCVRGACECAVVWDDPDTGYRCKARIDKLLPEGHNIVLDLKSAESADPFEFAKSAASDGYDLQAAFYVDGVKAVTGRECQYILIPQEKEPPYLSSLIDATDTRCNPCAVDVGRFKYRRAMNKLKACIDAKAWPGYGDARYPLQLPVWAIPEEFRNG